MASNDFDFSSIECGFVESDDIVNRVDDFVGLLAGDVRNGLLAMVFCGDRDDRGLGFSLGTTDGRASIKLKGTSFPSAMSASAANLQPFEFGLRSSACCISKPVVGIETFKFSYPFNAALVRGRESDELCDDVECNGDSKCDLKLTHT